MNIGRRMQVYAPGHRFRPARKLGFQHASDEYGNCSILITIGTLCAIVVFWEPPTHFQAEVELPEPGESAWIDKRYYR